MILLGVSGGSDSMLLLDIYKKKDIVVAHINYNKRHDSIADLQLVKTFCAKHNLPFKSLNVDKLLSGNFQAEARKIRYNFFEKVYKEYSCSKLLLAHHNDDFLETCIYQNQTSKNPLFFGIKSNIFLYNMNIERPFIGKYWKKDILSIVKKKEIKFNIDDSNFDLKYSRNRIRNDLLEKTHKEKIELLDWFLSANKILNIKSIRINRDFTKWEKTNFSIKYFSNLINKEEIVFKFLHTNIVDLKLSSKKLENIVNYILSDNLGKIYKLNNANIITKNIKKQLELKTIISSKQVE